MQRTPEPELMDGADQAQAYAAADFSAGDQALIERLDQLFPAGLGPRLADLGCGPGNISFRLARRHPQAEVLGIDGAECVELDVLAILGEEGEEDESPARLEPPRTVDFGAGLE